MKIYNMDRLAGKTELLIQKCIDSNFEYPIIVINNQKKKEVIDRISHIIHKIPPKNIVFTINEWFVWRGGRNIDKILIDDIEYMLPTIIRKAFAVDADIVTIGLQMDANIDIS